MNIRLVAANILCEIMDGSSLSESLEVALLPISDSRDRAFIQAVCYGVCRFYTRLDFILKQLVTKPIKAKDRDVQALLYVGLYQLMEMRIPPHAAVAETVAAAEKKPWAKALVNAVLRSYLRKREIIEQDINTHIEALYAHPLWWIEAIKKAWPAQWEAILLANNEHPPLALRVNQQRTTREKYGEKLKSEAHVAHIIPETENGIILESPIPVERLPGFSEGMISVQDGAAQLAAALLELKPHMHVLDACAAPGGKLLHILEQEPHLTSCVAVEKEEERIAPIKENLARLFKNNDQVLQLKIICHDAADTKKWWDDVPFDRILLDAPCTASGVIRRHPDIKLLRQPTDIQASATLQLHLLNALWPLLKPDGLLLYATCSLFPEENVQVLQRFLAMHTDAKEVKIERSWGLDCAVGRQILPGMHQMDGFYYARVKKIV